MTASTHSTGNEEKPLSPRTLLYQTIYFLKEHPLIWAFGILLSAPLFVFILFESLASQFTEATLLLITPWLLILLCLSVLCFFIGEAECILSFKKTPLSLIEHIAATGAIIRWYALFFLILLGFFAFFFMPFSLAPIESQTMLKYIGFTFFLLIASGAFIVKMFGGFYLLLSKLTITSAFRSSATLFMQYPRPSSLLFLATILLSLLGSISTSGISAFLRFPFLDALPSNILFLLVLLCFSSFINIFIRVFWYFFFRSIAGRKPRDWQKEKKMVKESMVPIEDEA